MKKPFLSAICIATLGLLSFSQAGFAQDQDSNGKGKSKDKLGEYDEIIIRKKGDKTADTKVTIEVKDGKVMVNGKPVEDYDNDDLSVIVRKERHYDLSDAGSPFRQHKGVWNFNGNNGGMMYLNSNQAFLGVATEKADNGVKVKNVSPKSAAEKAGLKEGDVITKVDEIRIESPEDLVKAIGGYKPDDKVTITYVRDGKESRVTATLGKREEAMNYGFGPGNMQGMPDMKEFHFDFPYNYGITSDKPRLGIKAQDTEDGKGVKVLDVDDGSAADKAGIRENDIITEFDGKTVNSTDDLVDAAHDAKEKTSVTVKLDREGKTKTVDVKIPRKLKTARL